MNSINDFQSAVEINSEVGKLESVIIHSPGSEVENMTPTTVQKALYSDILNLNVAASEYAEFKGVLDSVCKTHQVFDLLADILIDENVKIGLIDKINKTENISDIKDRLLMLSPKELAKSLIVGVELTRDNLSKYLSKEKFALDPLHNFFFTRDASFSVNNQVFISRMAGKIRRRESLIMEAIFNNHYAVKAPTINALDSIITPGNDFSFEGGDFLVARNDIIIVGTGSRTTPSAIDFILNKFKNKKQKFNIIVQELPFDPESFIHLDMVFTFLDKNLCMTFEPLIMQYNKFLTILISIDNGKVKISEEANIPSALSKLNFEVETIHCGGSIDRVTQEREQWHSGANFFAFAPAKVIGYSRNINTIDEMNKKGFEIIKASEIISGAKKTDDYNKCVVVIEGAELSRGGGGCRCMTMPVKRENI